MEQKHILVVDDDEPSRTLAARVLARGGYKVDTAGGAEEALGKTTANKFDLILLDVMMPGMDGFEVCARLRRSGKSADTPVIMLTALDSLDDIAKANEAGAQWFVNKPYDSKYLLSVVNLRSL